jgi:hypothetical protein
MLQIDTARTFTIAGVDLTVYADADSRDLFYMLPHDPRLRPLDGEAMALTRAGWRGGPK